MRQSYLPVAKNTIKYKVWRVFFHQGLLSLTLAIDRTVEEGGDHLFFFPICHFHALMNVQTFICNFACEMTMTYFQLHHLYLPDCYSIRFTTLLNYHLIDWWCNVIVFVCLLDDLILGFCYSNLTRETCGFQPASTTILVLEVNIMIKCASYPKYKVIYPDVTSD